MIARKHLQFISVSCLYLKVCKPFNVLKLHCVGKYWLRQRSVFCMNLEGNQKRCYKFDLISMTMHEWYKYPFNALAAMSYISPTNTPMSFSNLKKKMSKNILLMHWLQFVTPTPISFLPPLLLWKMCTLFYVYVCLYLIQYMYMYQWFENQ